MALRGRFRFAWTAAEATFYGVSRSSRCSILSSSFLLLERDLSRKAEDVVDAGTPVSRLSNPYSFVRVSHCEADYDCRVLGARTNWKRFQNSAVPMQIHSRCFAAKNWTYEEATVCGVLRSSCRSRRSVISSSFSKSFVLLEREVPLKAEEVVDAGTPSSRGDESRGFQHCTDGGFRLSNPYSFVRVSHCEADYKCRVLGARKRFQNFEVPMQIHSRCFATKNSSEEEEDGSNDEGARSGDDSKAKPDRSVKWHVDKLCPTSLRVRQLKEVDFDNIIEREKKLRIVLKVKDLLLADPETVMTLQDLGKCRDYIGLTGNKRIIALLKRYPGVFIVHENVEPGKLPWFQLTPEAEALCDEEREIRKGMKVEVVTKLRKLLMMSSDKRLMLGKIAHLARDIGLPEDFRTRLVYKYPKYFRVVEGEDVTNDDLRILELVKWSDRLAVTSEEQKVRDSMEENNLDSPPKLEIQLPSRYRLSNKDKYVLYKFHELECPSPYEASNYLNPASAEAEKRAVLLVKELLSLTLEKRMYVDHLTHFRKEFKFSNQVRGLLIRHPEHFYVSRKGARDTVFLREAFEGVHAPGQRQQYLLKDKHPLVDLKEKYISLMEFKRVPSTPQSTDSVPLQESFTSQEANELSSQENASAISV